MSKLYNSVIITGLKHCGKSSTAALLSSYFSVPFFDTDDEAEQIYYDENRENLNSREIYRRNGRTVFEDYELKAAVKIKDRADKSSIIAAAGGGICDNIEAIAVLRNSFMFIYIKEEADILYERIIRKGIPAFLSKTSPYKDFLDLYKKRSTIYDKLCNICIKAEGRSTRQIGDEIIEKLMEEGHAR
ncbi:MAG: shikimate kinase [Spirochaetales bacterium]|uniref:Shikimate kinase n=1 Tax=Candidatus Thalassospirochaeta sargassi TaxID=3119039 RepID=A0AAJ1IFY3_9SPIO|nr:shikimate kinase [Spirochaetales bacterium]